MLIILICASPQTCIFYFYWILHDPSFTSTLRISALFTFDSFPRIHYPRKSSNFYVWLRFAA
ncbi:unnamed protein product [Angiostrongylus costaricensis]|uniref:Secreted protein n=1 Tax=Angiostrongylus costaricensis TaxID=334426 RepID=A0A0R3PNG7_ANGCS|nr:unnamed protein product [Angiostrongylus costaricensis]